MALQDVVEPIGQAVDFVGVLAMVGGAAAVIAVGIGRAFRRHPLETTYRDVRHGVGQSILLGLELLIVGDIIRTVAEKPTFRAVGVLSIIVLIRTFLSVTLALEITGRWPWQPAPADPAPSGVGTSEARS